MITATSISSRENQVLVLLAQGLTVKEVANELHLSHHTIVSHKKSLFDKLNVVNCFQLGMIAERMGLLDELNNRNNEKSLRTVSKIAV